MGDPKLTLGIEARGAEEAARKVGEVDAAQKKTVDGTKASAEATEAAEKAQTKLNASESDHIELLNRVSPMLGGFVDGLLKGAKVAGDFAKQQLNVRGATRRASQAIRDNAAALKLIGAGGAVVAAIGLIVKSVHAMQDAFERVTQAIERDNQVMAENIRKTKELAAAYREAADARRMFEKTSITEQANASAQVSSVARRFGLEGKEGDLASVAASVQGLGLSQEQLVTLQLAKAAGAEIPLSPEATPSENRLQANLLLKSRPIQEAAEATRQRQRERMALLREAAQKELVSGVGGTTENLTEYLYRTQGIDRERAAVVAGKAKRIGAPSVGVLRDQDQVAGWPSLSGAWEEFVEGGRMVPSVTEKNFLGLPKTVETTAREYSELTTLLQSLNANIQKNNELIERNEGNPGRPPGDPVAMGGQPMYVNNRFVYPDAVSQRRAIVNGESRGRDAERLGTFT